MSVRVVSAPAPVPEIARRCFDLDVSLTLAEIIEKAMPGASEDVLGHLRVTLVRGDQSAVIPRAMWGRVRPHSGTVVILRVTAGWTAIIQAAGALTNALVGLGASVAVTNAVFYGSVIAISSLGVAALNALIPQPKKPSELKDPEETWSLAGWQNQATPGEPVPLPMGKIRVAPVFAAQPYSEIVGDEQYVRALFLFGYGRLKISDLRIGETSIDDFDGVTVELREGQDSDQPVTITREQVLEEQVGVELIRPEPRDASGQVISGPNVETPVVRRTASNATKASVILSFPGGLFKMDANDGSVNYTEQEVRIRQRLVGGSWSGVTTLYYRERKRSAFFRQYSWDLPSRGTWEIEVTRMIDDDDDPQRSRVVQFYALQSIRPEYPINMDKPLALAAVRIKSSYQLNGTLDRLNALVERYADDWDGSSWSEDLPRNPAALYAYALMGDHNAFPVTSVEIDWEALQDWHAFCEDKGLHYDRNHTGQQSLLEMISDIAAAGRASPRHDGVKWGVIIDRPREHPVGLISPRNSREFSGSRSFFDPPHGVRVRFFDETSDYEQTERVIPWLGHSGPIDLTEEMSMPGKTDPDEIEIEVVRRMHEADLRRDRWTVIMDGAARALIRGDRALLSHFALSDVQVAAYVRAVDGDDVTLDEEVEIEDGVSYGLTWQVYDDEDPVGTAVVAAVNAATVSGRVLTLDGVVRPAVGTHVAFGPFDEETEDVIVLDVEPAADFSARLTLTNAAPEIDTLTDAHVPSTWDPIIGSVAVYDFPAPQPPLFDAISSSRTSSGAVKFTVSVIPAPNDTVPIESIRLEHRESGGSSWAVRTVSAFGSAEDLSGYGDGTVVELRAASVSIDGDLSAYTATVTHEVGSGNVPLATALDVQQISITGRLGRAEIAVAVSDANTAKVQVYRVPDGDTLDVDVHAVGSPLTVANGQTTTIIDGDATRINLLSNGTFDSGSDWTAGGGWSIAGGEAAHTAGSSSTLTQGIALASEKAYRGVLLVSGVTAGTVTPSFTGGATVYGDAITADGLALFEITAATGGNTALEFLASATFDGALDNVQLYYVTPASAPQGVFQYYLAALNSDDIAAAVSGPIETTIY
ncbi:TipJ family phage tail tip protein [Tropicibacter sp. S64]|uniref:TipJ family phage tail tip protein n=1 Tax=Tropicibacter sp. S64 TaxID=3415122 RepID=UPI003C7EA4CE